MFGYNHGIFRKCGATSLDGKVTALRKYRRWKRNTSASSQSLSRCLQARISPSQRKLIHSGTRTSCSLMITHRCVTKWPTESTYTTSLPSPTRNAVAFVAHTKKPHSRCTARLLVSQTFNSGHQTHRYALPVVIVRLRRWTRKYVNSSFDYTDHALNETPLRWGFYLK